MACAAAGATIQIFAVYRAFAALVGNSRYASALLLSLAVCSAVANRMVLLTFMGRSLRSARWDWLAAALAVALMLVPVGIGSGAPAPSICVGTCGFVDGTWRSWVHWLPVLAYMGWSFGSACVFCYKHGTRRGRPGVRTGLWLVGLGCALALAWVALRVVVLAAWHAGLMTPRWQADDDWAEAGIWLVSMSAVGVGAVWEPLGDRARAAKEWLRALRSLWRLRRLWRALVASQPDVTLAGAPWTLRPVRLGLVRCIVEIRDCLREVELSVSGQVLAAIERQVASADCASRRDADALVTAAVLRWWMSERPVLGAGGCRLPAGDARDLAADATWLEQVARFFAGPGSQLATKAVAAAKTEVAA
jgi:hypothetical protein